MTKEADKPQLLMNLTLLLSESSTEYDRLFMSRALLLISPTEAHGTNDTLIKGGHMPLVFSLPPPPSPAHMVSSPRASQSPWTVKAVRRWTSPKTCNNILI